MRLCFQKYPILITIMGLCMIILFFTSPATAAEIKVTGNTVQNWAFTPGEINVNPNALKLTITTSAANWDVKVKEDAQNNGKNVSRAGRLLEYNTGTGWVNEGSMISTNMTIIGGDAEGITGNEALLGPEDNLVETGVGSVTDKQVTIALRQPMSYTDPRLTNGNEYRVALTFTLYEY